MQKKTFKMYYFSYLSAVFYYKDFVCKHYLKPKQVICSEKLSFGVYIYWQFFQPVIWRVADLPAFAFDALRQKSVGRTSNSWRLCK
jgi:hypothetical protein